MSILITEIIGWVAVLILAISCAQKRLKKLRIINLISAAFFIIQGVLLDSLSFIFCNIFTSIINIYMLLKVDKYSNVNSKMFREVMKK